VGDIADGLERVLGDEARAAALRALGLARAAGASTWRDAAIETARAYAEALDA
jgi:hypothetical protein